MNPDALRTLVVIEIGLGIAIGPKLLDWAHLDEVIRVLAGGSMGEIGPIIAISVALTTDNPGRTTAVLVGFGAVALGAAWLATREARHLARRVFGRHGRSAVPRRPRTHGRTGR